MHLLFPLNVFELIFDAEIVVQIQLLLPQCDKAPGTPRYPRDYNKNENVYVYDDSSNDNHNTDKHQQPRQPTTIDEAYDGDDKNNNRDINTDQQYNDNHAQQRRRRRRRQFSSDSPKRQANVCSTIDFGFAMPRTTTCEDAKRTREDETKTCNRHIVGHTLPRSPEGSDTGGGGQGRRTDNKTDRQTDSYNAGTRGAVGPRRERDDIPIEQLVSSVGPPRNSG
jgi:hypothetical protein